MPTIRDVAALARVSTATVSHVVNGTRNVGPETRRRVELAIAELGYAPGRTARSRGGARPHRATGPSREVAGEARSARAARPGAAEPHHTVRRLLRLVRAAQPISRAELARSLGIHRGTVTAIVKPLLSSGALREAAADLPDGRRGRPPVGLSLGGEEDFFVGVNIGVRQTQVGAATARGATIAIAALDTPPDAGAALEAISVAVAEVAEAAAGRTLVGIGISVPGPVDAGRSRLLRAPHLGWGDVDVAGALRRAAARAAEGSVAVTVENDATAAAVYERRRRWARAGEPGASDDFVLVRAGTGIGVGLVLKGEIYRGTGQGEGMGGEFGHMTIVAGGRRCVCGNRGCWEQYASARSAAARYASEGTPGPGGAPRFADVVARAMAGELRAHRTLEETGEYLGIGIANIITGVGIPRVVVSGRIVLGFEFLREPLFEAIERTMAGHLATWSVEAGESTGAGLGGALEVAVDERLVAIADSAGGAERPVVSPNG